MMKETPLEVLRRVTAENVAAGGAVVEQLPPVTGVEIYECEGHGFYFEWYVDGEYVAVTGTDAFIPDGAVLHTFAEWLAGEVVAPFEATRAPAMDLPEPVRSRVLDALHEAWPQDPRGDEPDDLGTYPDAAEIYEATAGHGMEEGER